MTLIDGTRTACSTAHKDQPLSVTTRQSSPQGVAAGLPSPPSPPRAFLERSGGLQIPVPQNQRLFLWPDGGSRSWGGEFRHFVLIIIGAGFSCLAIVRLKGNLLDIKLDCSFWFDWLDDVY